MTSPDWWIFRGEAAPHDAITRLPAAPPWRAHHPPATEDEVLDLEPDPKYIADTRELELVNTAMYLRRPLLVTGPPGLGKSSLAHAVAHELQLGRILLWPITTRTTLQDGLYLYDAIGRLREVRPADLAARNDEDIGQFIQLGPLGTALLPRRRPRVLLIDEIDKSDIDLPNDLLHTFERGWFEIPELARVAGRGLRDVEVGTADRNRHVTLHDGQVECAEFPLVFMTSNGERDFPPAFLRRCIRLELKGPDQSRLEAIVRAKFGVLDESAQQLVRQFCERQTTEQLATDQLLNAVFLACNRERPLSSMEIERVLADVLRNLRTSA